MSFKKQFLIITVILAAIMELIDTSIVNVSISNMSGNLGATLEDTEWVITSYAIANVIIIPITSFLTNRLGRRNYYIGSIILFTICSFLCGNASGIWELVAFRFLQGLGGGALLSVSAAVVYEQFPKEKIGVASALFGLGVFIGPTIGPTLGGFITEDYSWPWIFYINIPIGIFVATSSYFLLRESPIKTTVSKVDWTGIALLVGGVGSLQTVLERGQTEDWFSSKYILVLTIVAVVCLVAFVLWELHTPAPVVNLRVLRSRSLSVAAVLTFISGLGLFTSVFLTPVFAQRILDFSPSQTGTLLLPGAIVAIFALVISGRLLQRGIPPAIMALVGFLFFIYFNWAMSKVDLHTSWYYMATTLIARGVGIALLTVPLSTLAVSSLAATDIPQGTALNNMMRQLGGSFGLSIITTFLTRRTQLHRVDLLSNVYDSNPALNERINQISLRFQQTGASFNDAKLKALGVIDHTVVKQSSLLSYIDAFLLIGIIFAVALPLLFFEIGGKKKAAPKVPIMDH